MGKKKETPEIIDKIVEFFKYWQNPDRIKGNLFPIKEFQLQIYSVSSDFIFKWFVTEEELINAAKYINIIPKNNILEFSLGAYNIELAVRLEN